MVLNLRHLQHARMDSIENRSRSISGLKFATSAFLGNIGAPLRDGNDELEDNPEDIDREPPNEDAT